MGCLEVLQIQPDIDQEIYSETGTAGGVCDTQRQGKMDFLFRKISSVAPQQPWHFACLVVDVSVLQRHLLESSLCYYDVSSTSHLG